jgi:AraC family transcriptional regulator of adaptative response / DNA-3-methyladenine glycosylase II
VLRLAYRPPLAWEPLLAFLAARAIPGVEAVAGDTYRRTIHVGGASGSLEIGRDPERPALWLRVHLPESHELLPVVERARRIFDLGCDPAAVARHLAASPLLAPRLKKLPGLRVPGAWDGFELAVRAVLGQQVSVAAATRLSGRLVQAFGKPLEGQGPGLTHCFPAPAALADADIASIGMPRARAETLRAIARAAAEGQLFDGAALGLDAAVERLCAIPGVGPWTAHYVAMRALGEPDAFPASDLGLRRALAANGRMPGERALLAAAEPWRPWRAYAAVLIWLTGAGPAAARRKERR